INGFYYWTGYLALSLGAIYPLGIATMLLYSSRASPRIRELLVVSAVATAAFLLPGQLVRSVIVANNDFGWRSVLPAVLILSGWASIGMYHIASRALFGGWVPRSPMLRERVAVVGAALSVPLVMLGNLNAIGFRERLRPLVVSDEQRGLHRDFFRQRKAWEAVRAATKATDIVLSNYRAFERVTLFPSNAPWALFSDRRSLLGDPRCAFYYGRHLGPARIDEEAAFVDRIFSGGASYEDVDVLANAKRVEAILVTSHDPLWNAPATLESQYQMTRQTRHWRLYLRRDHEA